MSRAALIESLRRKAAEDAEAIWRDAKAGAEKYRLEMAQALEQQRAQRLQTSVASARLQEEASTAQARHRAREILTNASIAFAGRLHRLALAELARMRSEGADPLFVALAAELPAREWQAVKVNPADRDRAQQHFPRAEIVCVEAITGGIEAEAEGGRIRVSNTLETRLATTWPDVLPGLIANILTESHGHQPVA